MKASMFQAVNEEAERRKKTSNPLNISGVLKRLELSSSGFYKHRKQLESRGNQMSQKDLIKEEILFIHGQSKFIYGAPKIHQELLKKGYRITEKTVGNYMRQMNIKACYIKPYTSTTIDPDFDNELRNILSERYNPEQPNAVWCSDITYISTDEGFCYLTSIMDLFSRRIIAWRLSLTLEAKWVVECVETAKETRRGAKPFLVHSDRGSQYISKAYLEALEGVELSYSQKASPWQNACIESFHALLKREWIYRFKIRNYGHARQLVFEYIEAFYNTIRSHSHCDYLSPKEYEEYYYIKLSKSLARAI